jgi:hypothetical protein
MGSAMVAKVALVAIGGLVACADVIGADFGDYRVGARVPSSGSDLDGSNADGRPLVSGGGGTSNGSGGRVISGSGGSRSSGGNLGVGGIIGGNGGGSPETGGSLGGGGFFATGGGSGALSTGGVPTGGVPTGDAGGCQIGEKRCGGNCVVPASSNGCGLTSCTPCPGPAPNGGVLACDDTNHVCDFVCLSGFIKSGSSCVPTSAGGASGSGGSVGAGGGTCVPANCPRCLLCGASAACCTTSGRCGCPSLCVPGTCV